MNSNLARSISLACTLLVSVFLTACGGEQTPQLVMCDQPVNTSSPVLNNGFGFNLNNTRNQPSSINSSNVANLELDFTLNAKKRQGTPRRPCSHSANHLLPYTRLSGRS